MTNCFIMWEYINGGVLTHHLLADPSMPGLSNWWGLLSIPVVTFILLSWRDRNRDRETSLMNGAQFFLAIAYGVIMCILWRTGNDAYMPYLLVLPILISIWKPVHSISAFLGLLFGLMYAFGGILPIMLGIVLTAASFIVHHTLGRGMRMLTTK